MYEKVYGNRLKYLKIENRFSYLIKTNRETCDELSPRQLNICLNYKDSNQIYQIYRKYYFSLLLFVEFNGMRPQKLAALKILDLHLF